jgi:uncharacterized damage-inducible protein DinB
MKVSRLLPALAVCLFSAAVFAQQAPRTQTPSTQGAASKNSFRTEFLAGVDELEEKIDDLAAATPADRYGWRPAPGVRSIGEVYMHIAGGNYYLATFVGKAMPADVPKDLEKITDKQKILAELKKSFEHARKAVTQTKDADFEKKVKLYGTATTYRGVYVTMLNHMHEHLGQSIAYARMNGIAPPWSR